MYIRADMSDSEIDSRSKDQVHREKILEQENNTQSDTTTGTKDQPDHSTTAIRTLSLNKASTTSGFKTAQSVASFLANVAVLIGIGFALIQLIQSDKSEKRRLAIEAVNQTRSSEFLNAYANLKTAYRDGQVKGAPSLRNDINFVMNVYDHIALLYNNNLADRCIIKGSIHSAVKDLSPICDAMSYPKEYRTNIDILLALMDQEHCH